MKYAIVADIHGHLAALQAVVRDAEQQGCTHTACLGDIVGCFDKPKECVDLIRGMAIPCVKGNHDECCATDMALDDFSLKGAANVAWTRQQLSEDDCLWLRSLKLVDVISGFTIVHAVLNEPGRWGYAFDRLAAAASFAEQKTPVCFFGHTHVPLSFVRDTSVRGGIYSKFNVEPGKQYFVNVGSVGQQRDGTQGAAYAIYDLENGTVELRRVECDCPGIPPTGAGDFPVPVKPLGPKPRSSTPAKPED